MGIGTGLQYPFVCNYCMEMVNRKLIEHNASCKSGLPNTSNTDTQHWELNNSDIGENMEIFKHINAKFNTENIHLEISYACVRAFLFESKENWRQFESWNLSSQQWDIIHKL